jgi:hypothetical protein
MTISVWIALIVVAGGAGGVLYLLRHSFKNMGAVEEREKQTYRKIKGAKDAKDAQDEVAKMSDDDVVTDLGKWMRDE